MAVAVVVAGAGGGCRDDRVRVSFRPSVGDVYRYETVVRTETTVAFDDQEPTERRQTSTLRAEHRVVRAGSDGVVVRVELEGAGEPLQTFQVRYDDARVEEVSGGAGVLGLPEIVPAGAGGPPDRRLEPGERWDVDERLQLPGAVEPSRLQGSGRLVALGVADGRDVAEVRTHARLDVRSGTLAADGTLLLDGEQATTTTSSHDIEDGSVRQARATTTARYDARLAPPPGAGAEPVEGEVTVRVTSVTRRLP